MAGKNTVDAKTYAKNVLKSAKYIGVQTIKGVNPTLTDYVSDNVQLSKDMYSEVKNFKTTIKNKLNSVLGETGFEDLKAVKGNFFSDLKTGKFYNPEREEENETKTLSKMGFSFDFDFDDLDFDVDENYTSDKEESQSTNTNILANKLSFSQQKSSMASAELIVGGATRNTRATLAHTEKMFGTVNRSLSAINSSILAMHSDLATPLNAHIQNSTAFYQTATNELAKQTSYLENINKLITDRFTPTTKPGFKNSGKASPWEEIMGGGMPNIRAIGSLVKNRTINSPEMSMLTSMLSPEMAQMFLGMGLSSPVALLMSSLFGGAIKRGPIGKSLDRTLKTIQGGSIKVASRIHNYNQKAKGQGFLGMLANIFDIIPQKAGKMDFGNYNKGRADWTGKDSKALQDVIPTQLSEIITLLSGKPAKIFDYETGKWKSAKDVRADFSRARIKNFGNADSSFKEEILKEFIDEDFYNPENIKNKTPRYTMNSRAVRSLSKDYDMLITLLSTKGVSLSKYTKAQELITDCKKFGWVGPDALLGEDNLKTLAKIIFKRRTNVTRFEGAVYTGRLSDARFVESNTGGAFANIVNGSNLGTAHSTGIGLLANSVDEDKHNVFYYLSNILKEIKGFKPTGGFGKPSSGRTDTASERQRTPVRSNVVTSSELIDDWIVNDRENRYTDDDTEGRQVYNSETKRYENYKGPAAMSRHTRELKAEREEKTNFISRGIDKFNSALESIMYGDAGEAIKKKYREAGGLFGIVKNLPEIIKKGVDIVKDFLKDKWNKFKDSGFGKAYFGEMKNSIKNFAKDTFEYGKSRAKDAANWLKTGWSADIVADPPKAAKGGYVKKSGMASVSEGELIIPANKNPFYKGKMSNKQRDNIENLNLLNWIKDGAPGGSFMGSYADGGTVKGPKKKLTLDQLKAKVQGRVHRNKEEYDDTHWPNLNKKQKKALINMARHGFTDEEIARQMTLDIRQVRQILNKNAVSENLNKFGNTVKTGAKKAGGFIKDKLDAWLGDSKTYKNVKDATGEVVRASKVNLPKTFASGTLGALVGAAATGSGIGLLGGLVIGAGTEVLRNSDKISKFLFGEKDKDGNYTGGKLHPKLTKFIKEKLPKTAKAGAIGGVFGALGLAPGGIFGGMAIGAGLDLLSTTSKFQDLMFGKVSADGKRKGGLVRSLKINIVDPLTTFVKDGIGKVGTFFKEEIFNPIKSIFKPIKDRATGKMLAVKDSMTSFASDKVKSGAMYLMDSILGSTSRKVGKAGKFGIKLGSKILAAPAKMVGGIANRMSYVNAKKGYSSLSPEERMNIINNGTGIGYAIIDVVGMGVTTITDTITNIVKKIGSTIFKGLKIIGSKIGGFFKKVFSPAIDYIKEEILSPVKDFVSNQIFKPIKNFIKDKIVKNIKEKVVDRAKKFLADRRAKTPIMRYNKFAAENKDQILDMAHYLNGTNSFKRSQKAKRQNLLNTMLASLENGGMGDPDTIKSIKKAFNTKKLIEDNDFSDVINMVELLSSQNKIGDAEKNALYEVINRTKAEIQSEKAKQENFDENKTAFLTKYGFDLSKMKKRDVRKLKIQSQIDAKRITGTSLKDLDDLLINGRRQDKALALLKEQEQNNPLDYQRNQDLRTVRDVILSWDYNVRRANAPLALPPGNPNNVQTASDIVNNATGSTPLALPPGNSNILALPAPSSASSPKKGDIKNEIVNGIPTQYVYDGKEWNLNTSDADTKESKEAIETKNKFYEMFVDGGLLSSLKGVFGFGKKDDKEEKTSFWDKIKDFFGGENGIFTSLFNALGGTGGIGSVLLRVLPGAIGAGLLTYGLGKYGQSSAGTGLDSGMYAGADAEARKAEVADMGGIKKVGLGINVFENKLRGRDTTTYNQDDYITQYETSRIGERMAKNALYSFNPTYAKRAQGVIRKTIGKVPFIGKPAAAVVGATNNVGALTKEVGKIATSGGIKNYLLEEVATTTNKKKAAILGGIYDAGENFSKKMKSAGKAIKNSKVGTAATNIFGKLKSTGLGKAASSAISKLKEKILNILKTVALKVGIKEASSEAMEEASKMAAREIVKRAGKNALKIAAKIVPIVNLVFIANAVLSGFQKAKAKTILGILDDPTVGQRVLAATLNGINEAIPGIGGIIPTEVLFSIMFTVLKWLGADFENLTEQRAEAKATVEAYNRENGTTYNVEEYIHNVLGEYTIQERITKGVSKGWDKVKSFFSSHKDDEETENSEFSNEVDTTIQSDSKKAATPGGFGSNDYNNPSGFGVDGPQQEAKGSGIFKNLNQYTTNSNYNLGAKGSGLVGGASGTDNKLDFGIINTSNLIKDSSKALTTGAIAVGAVTKQQVLKADRRFKEIIKTILTTALNKFRLSPGTIEMNSAIDNIIGYIHHFGGSNLYRLIIKSSVILNVGFIANAILSGVQSSKAKSILGIIDTPTPAQRCIAGIINGLNEAIPGIGGIIPTETLFNIIYTQLKNLGCDFGDLDKQRSKAKETLDSYNNANNTDYSIDDYVHNIQNDYTVQEKIGNFFKSKVSSFGAKGSGLVGGASGTYDFNNNINQIVRKTRNSNSYKDTMTSSSYSGFMSDSNTVDTKSLVAAQNIGGKVSALFENISAEIPDVTGMIGDLWKLSDPNNVKNNSYDKVLRKYKQRENSNSLMGGFGNSLVNSVSGVMKIVNSVVTPFRFMSSMMSGTLDDSSLSRMNSVAGKGTGNIISNAFNSIKTFFSNGVNSVKGFFSNVGSGVSNAVSNTADAIKNFITGNSTGTSTGSGVGDGESYWSGGGTGNSPLVTVTKISPNKTSPRNHAIDTITIHCTAGPGTASQILDIFVPKSRKASCNYAIGYDGSIGLCVEEKDRSWCSTNAANDNRAITIEVSSESVAPYKVTDKAYNSLINLLIDVCRRNGIKKLLWKADARYVGNVSMQNMTVHRWFAAKACPGDYLYNLHGDIANAVNAGLGTTTATTTQNTTTTAQAATTNIPSATSNLKNGPLNSGTKNGNTGAIMSTLNNSNWTSGNNAGSGSGVIPIHTSQIGNYARFGNTNIDQNGCGPAVASTVLKAYGKNVGIDTAAKYAEDRDYVAGASKVEGTRASYFSDILGSNGINTRYTDKTSDIKSSIKSGKPTILLGQDRSNKSKANSPFGPNPHYVVARGMDRRGNVIVDDPEQKRTTVYNRNIINNTKLGIATGRGWLDTVSGKINNVGRSLVDSFLDIGRTPATTTTNNKTTNNATNNKTKADNDPTATTDTSTTNATEVDTSMTTDTSTTATTTDSTSSSSGTNGIQGFVSKAFGNVLGSVYNKLDPNSAAAKVFSHIFISNSSEDSSSSTSDSGTYSGTGSANFTPIPLGAGTADLETVIPEKYRPLYNKTTSGGLSDCFSSNPSVADDKTKQKKYDVLPNCVGWAWGRFSHISSEINGGVKFYNRYRGNPGIDMFNGMAANGYETSTTTPKPGALIIWKGHIAVVESVLENGDIVRSESEYNGGKLLNTGTSTKASGYSYGSHGKAVGFVYNPYVKEYTDSGTGNSDANAKKVWSYLINKGMSKHGIAGLLGCWMVESAVTPKRIEADTSSSFPGYDVIQDPNQLSNWSVKACRINKGTLSGYKCKNGKYACGIGMAQWTADRTWSLVEYANNNNRKWYDLYCQLDFMLYEITEQYPSYYKSTYNALKNATSTDAATSTILRNYEGGGNNKLAQRQAYAREFYNKFANTTTRTNATLGAKGSGLLDDIFSTDAKTIAKYSSKSGGKSGSKANTTHVLKRSNILSGSINKYRGSASNIIKTSNAGSNDFTRSSANGKVFSNNYYRQINKIKGSASNILSSDQANGISTYRGNNYTAKMSDVILNGLVNDSNVDLNTYTVQDQQKQQILQTLNLTKITEYLDIIASNTKYNSSIPEIVKIISESLDTLSNINTNTSSTTTRTTRSTSRAAKAQDEADNYQAAIENKIKLMRAKLEAISKTL